MITKSVFGNSAKEAKGEYALQIGILEKPAVKFYAAPSLSNPVAPWRVLKATVIKDLRIAMRYRANLIGSVIELTVRVLFFLLMADVISFTASEALGRSLTGSDLFVFFQGALMLSAFNSAALGAPLGAVNRDLYNGTLEFLHSNPSSWYAYYVGTILSNIIINQVVFLPLYLFLVFYSGAQVGNMLMVLVVCVTLLIALMALGIMVAMLGLLWRRADSAISIVQLAFEFLTGGYLPLLALPQVIQYIAYILPLTWAYDLIRYYSFDRDWGTILPVWQEWAALIVFAVIFTVLSRYLLKKAEQLAKQKGFHLI